MPIGVNGYINCKYFVVNSLEEEDLVLDKAVANYFEAHKSIIKSIRARLRSSSLTEDTIIHILIYDPGRATKNYTGYYDKYITCREYLCLNK